MATIQVDHVQWFDVAPIKHKDGQDAYPGCDGAVWYLVLVDRRPGDVVACTTHPDKAHLYCFQPFSRTVATTPDGRAVWRWDGNRDAPTLTDPAGQKDSFKVAAKGFPAVHLYFRAGRIVYIDGEAVPHPEPVPCRRPD